MKYNFESGRSMVEMLGTLAIIGVLSIGSIAGYSYGMDKYRANETINDVNLRGIDLVRQVAIGQTTLSLSEWPTISKAGYDISEPVLSTEGDAYFTISGVPKRVCEIVYDGIMQNQTTDVEVNGYVVDDSSACGDDNIMGFFFITNAGEGGTNPEDLCKDKTCPEGFSCTHGICMSEEVPQKASRWKRCKSDNSCGICEECIDRWGDGLTYCNQLSDGTSCGSGGQCQKGQCVANNIPIVSNVSVTPTSTILNNCTDNSDCEQNYYCGHLCDGYKYDGPECDIYDSKTCIFAEFTKVPLSDGDYFYVSAHKNLATDAEALCDAIGTKFIENFENRMDIVDKLKDFSLDNGGFEGLSKTQTCLVYPDSYSFSAPNNYPYYIVCVKEN